MNRRPETIADVRQNHDEREPLAVLRATDPYAVEIMALYGQLLIGEAAGAVVQWETLWKQAVRERPSSDQGDLITRGGMATQLSCEMREFRDRGPVWRVLETYVKNNPLGQVRVVVLLADEKSDKRILRVNRKDFGGVFGAMEMIYGGDSAANEIATSDDWLDVAPGELERFGIFSCIQQKE